MKKRIFMLILISFIILTGCESNKKEESRKIVENNGMLSYTIDGEKTDIKPTKEDGYIVNKIICDNGSDLMWDNDNWEVELTKVNSKDRCKVDFTKDTSKEGYRVTVTSNMSSALDSLSKATTLNGTIKIYSTSKIKSVTGCNGVIEENKVIVSNITSNQICNIIVEQTLVDTIKEAYTPKLGRTNFTLTAENIETGLYTGTDDQGTTYYFSGDGRSMKNWVSFAGKMWRIIRINGNGSVRLLYAGSGGTDGYVATSAYNSTNNHPAYVGWKYTVGGNLDLDRRNSTASGAYNAVESWYNTSITNVGLTNYIDTGAIYCNDRSIGSGEYSTSVSFYYGAYTRLYTNNTPTLECSDAADRFTTFGLMTADEVVYGGGIVRNSNNITYYYLNKVGRSSTGNNLWWTMSPGYWDSNNNSADTFVVSGDGAISGNLGTNPVGVKNVIRPVISLKPEVQVTSGDGSADSPYEVTI